MQAKQIFCIFRSLTLWSLLASQVIFMENIIHEKAKKINGMRTTLKPQKYLDFLNCGMI